MEIWIKQGNDAIQLPILPPSFSVTAENSHQTVYVQTKGEVSILGKRGLHSIELSSYFPGQEYPFAAYVKDREPFDYIKQLESWASKTVRCTITETNINETYVVQGFVYGEPDGSGDVEYTLSLKEYRKPTYTEPEKKSQTSTATGKKETVVKQAVVTEREMKEPGKTYTVKSGDNLWNIAKSFYGSGAKSSVIYGANKDVIEKTAQRYGYVSSSHSGIEGWWIFPGTELVIP